MLVKTAIATLVLLLPAVPTAAHATEYKKYCVVTTTPTGPQAPTVCVVDPTA